MRDRTCNWNFRNALNVSIQSLVIQLVLGIKRPAREGKRSASPPALPPGKNLGVYLTEGCVGPTEPVWTFWRRDKSVDPGGIRTPGRPARSLVTVPLRTCIFRHDGTKFSHPVDLVLGIHNQIHRLLVLP
jgi:hypothetical protein